jgi:hypothetical protein
MATALGTHNTVIISKINVLLDSAGVLNGKINVTIIFDLFD